MAVNYGFFDSVDGDRKYNASQMSSYFDGLISNGVYANFKDGLQVVASSGMTIQVKSGKGMINGRWVLNDSPLNLTVPNSDLINDRIDAVMMRLNMSDRNITFTVKSGVPGTSPVAPNVTRNTNIVEYCLAQILVPANSQSISQSNITDTRANTTICGWITGLIEQVDTSTLFAQWQSAYAQFFDEAAAEFYAWFDTIKSSFGKIVKYESSYTTTTETTTFPIGVAEYSAGDAVLVHVGGILLTETEYSISGTNIVLNTAAASGRTYTCIVFKSAATA